MVFVKEHNFGGSNQYGLVNNVTFVMYRRNKSRLSFHFLPCVRELDSFLHFVLVNSKQSPPPQRRTDPTTGCQQHFRQTTEFFGAYCEAASEIE